MNTGMIFGKGEMTTAEALELFDRLEPVETDFMLDRWRGSGFNTGHPMDGLLEIFNWYGKEFIDPETVHPLLFLNSRDGVFKVAVPSFMMDFLIKLPAFQDSSLKSILPPLKPVLIRLNSLMATDRSQARLRMVEYRGTYTAAMVYDYLPIIDVFKKVDDRTVLGVMDLKNLARPFFFRLDRV